MDDRRDQLYLGAMLIAIGAIVAAGRLIPEMGEWVVLGVGLVPLVLFFVTRWDWAMIWGSIQTGAGTGVVLVAEDGMGADPGFFLLALAAGFGLVSLLATVYRFAEHRLWPLVPAAILAIIGVVQLAGAPDFLGSVFEIGWPVALLLVGAALIVRALIRSRSDGRGE